MERQGPLYEAIREVLREIDERRDDHDKRLNHTAKALGQQARHHDELANALDEYGARLSEIEATVKAHNHAGLDEQIGFEDRLKVIEERLTALAKVNARPVTVKAPKPSPGVVVRSVKAKPKAPAKP